MHTGWASRPDKDVLLERSHTPYTIFIRLERNSEAAVNTFSLVFFGEEAVYATNAVHEGSYGALNAP